MSFILFDDSIKLGIMRPIKTWDFFVIYDFFVKNKRTDKNRRMIFSYDGRKFEMK